MIRKLDIEQRALVVAPEVSFRWTDDSKLRNEQNSTSAWCCSWRSARLSSSSWRGLTCA